MPDAEVRVSQVHRQNKDFREIHNGLLHTTAGIQRIYRESIKVEKKDC